MAIAFAVFVGVLVWQLLNGIFPRKIESGGWVIDEDGSSYPKGHKYDDRIPW